MISKNNRDHHLFNPKPNNPSLCRTHRHSIIITIFGRFLPLVLMSITMVGGGGIQRQGVGFSLFDHQQQPTAALAANGGEAARNGGFSFRDDNQSLLSSGANGDASD